VPRPASLSARIAIVCGGLLAACATYSSTTRVFNGRVEQGPVISPEAYAFYLRGALEEAALRWPQALEAYDMARRASPDSAPLHVRLGRVACKLGVGRRADAEFARALDLAPDYAPLFYEQSECAEQRGRYRAAIGYAERALGLASDDLATTLQLAALYEHAREPHTARALLAGFAATHPDSDSAWSALWSFSQRHPDTAWATLAQERSRPVRTASPGAPNPCPAALSHEPPGHREVLNALANGDETGARQTALACRFSGVTLAEWALAAGQPAFALREAQRTLLASPGSSEAFAMALLAAHRAGDDAAFDELLLRDRQLTDPTPRSRDWTLQLLRERGY
jgi:tetratricopeptide (TPR) repeat protein